MAIKSGETTYHQAKRGIVQNGLVLNLDAGVDASYDGGTTWRDLEGGNNGTLTNGPTFDSDNGGSIVFDGSDDYIAMGGDILDISSPFSFFYWCKLGTISNNYTVITGNTNFAVRFKSSQWEFIQKEFSPDRGYTGVTYSPLDVWTCLCVTHANSVNSIYVDGSLINSWSISGTSNSTTTSNIGTWQYGKYNGSIDLEYKNGTRHSNNTRKRRATNTFSWQWRDRHGCRA